MDNILAEIIATKKREVARWDRGELPPPDRAAALSLAPAPDFFGALAKPGRIRVIAEVKHRSPSAGVIRTPFEPSAIALDYVSAGADALSVLTDEPYFGGHLAHLSAVGRVVSAPLLRKEFILDPRQLWEARLAGASAALLIAECLSPRELADLVAESRAVGLEPLVELHDPDQLTAVLDSGTRIVGINNRDLRRFVTRLEHTLDLLPRVPSGVIVVSESGIKTAADVTRLAEAGVHALLIGETLLRHPSPGAKLRELLGEPG